MVPVLSVGGSPTDGARTDTFVSWPCPNVPWVAPETAKPLPVTSHCADWPPVLAIVSVAEPDRGMTSRPRSSTGNATTMWAGATVLGGAVDGGTERTIVTGALVVGTVTTVVIVVARVVAAVVTVVGSLDVATDTGVVGTVTGDETVETLDGATAVDVVVDVAAPAARSLRRELARDDAKAKPNPNPTSTVMTARISATLVPGDEVPVVPGGPGAGASADGETKSAAATGSAHVDQG